MTKQFYVYKITNLINGKMYIGKGTCSSRTRWQDHLMIARGGKIKYPKHFYAIHSAIVKYGESNFKYEEIDSFEDEALAYNAEKQNILQCRNIGIVLYNLTDGGDGALGRTPSLESRLKMSKSHLGIKKDPNTIVKMKSSAINGRAKLDFDIANEIRKSHLTTKELAAIYNVSIRTIQLIRSGSIWNRNN